MSGASMATHLMGTILRIRDVAMDGDGGDSVVDDVTNMKDALGEIIRICEAIIDEYIGGDEDDG